MFRAAPVLLVALFLSCSGCDRRSASTETPAATPAASGGSASVSVQVFGDPAEIAAYREMVAAFEAAHPGQRVELIPVGTQSDHMAKLSAAYASGRGPDVFVLNFRRFGQFAERGVIEPAGPALASRGYDPADFYEPSVEAFTMDGTLMCAPQNVSSLVVYYNRALFLTHEVPLPKPGWTYNDLLRAAQKLTRDTDGDGQTDLYGVALEPLLIRLAPFIWSMGGELVNDLHRPTMLTLDRPAALNALSAVRNLNSRFGVVPPLAAHQAEDEDSRFARGGVAMLFQSRRFTTTLRHIEGLDWDVAPFPRLRYEASALHADAYCLSKAAAPRDAALDFIAFATGETGQAILTRTGRLVPARRSVAESPVFLDPDQRPASAQVFLDAIPHLRRTPNVAVWHEVESRADVILEEWFFEPLAAAGGSGYEEGGAEAMTAAVLLRDAIQPVLLRPLAKDQADD